jgi:hypothetical protein
MTTSINSSEDLINLNKNLINSYSSLYSWKEFDSDFYYVAMKTTKRPMDLVYELKKSIEIYNIISISNIVIFILSSETRMELTRTSLSELFDPKGTFDVCGEGFSVELCIDMVKQSDSMIPEYNEYHNEALKREEQLIFREKNIIKSFYNVKGLLDHVRFRGLISKQRPYYINWIVEFLIIKVRDSFGLNDPFIHNTIKHCIMRYVISSNKHGSPQYHSMEELGALLFIMNNCDNKIEDYIDKLISKNETICCLLNDRSIFEPDEELDELCSNSNKCLIHTKFYIIKREIKPDMIIRKFNEILEKMKYLDVYMIHMLYFFSGVKKSGLLSEIGLIRLILDLAYNLH